jgi:predicted ATPase
MSKAGLVDLVSPINATFQSITAGRILSFGDPPVTLDLRRLNILIGPNGTGKSNLIEIFGLLHSLPSDISDPFRVGGGIDEWMWRGGGSPSGSCELEVKIKLPSKPDPIRYALKLRAFQLRPEIIDERIEFTKPRASERHPYFFYQFQDGRPVINVHDKKRSLHRETLDLNQSVLKQRKDPETYPEITAVGQLFERISLYRDWSVGIDSAPRDASPIDGKADFLEEDAGNFDNSAQSNDGRTSN